MERKLKIIPSEMEWTYGKVKGFAGKDLIKLDNGTLKLVKVEAGASYPTHQHPDKTEFAYVVSGTPEFMIGETTFQSQCGDFFIFPRQEMHSIHNHSNGLCELLIGAIRS
ncbi:MAG: cupin domain-containing protein [Niabella sp.]